jgi:hypothetical protein
MKRFAIALALLGSSSAGCITVTLDNNFIETFKRRATIEGSFTVEAAHHNPKSITEDGDMHIAGSCPEVGLPLVAEIMNARKYTGPGGAIELLRQLDANNGTTNITGVWRLWFEHPGSTNQVQFANNPITGPHPTNPDHVFEIHPVTQFGQFPLLDSLVPIQQGNREFSYKVAADAFALFRNKDFEIEPAGDTTKITTTGLGQNYVKFKVKKLPASTFEVQDGTFMYVSVYAMTGSLIKRKVRIVMPAGTPPQAALRNASQSQKVTVIGMPRISLSLVSYRRDHPETWNWKLPYEMVIVAIK